MHALSQSVAAVVLPVFSAVPSGLILVSNPGNKTHSYAFSEASHFHTVGHGMMECSVVWFSLSDVLVVGSVPRLTRPGAQGSKAYSL